MDFTNSYILFMEPLLGSDLFCTYLDDYDRQNVAGTAFLQHMQQEDRLAGLLESIEKLNQDFFPQFLRCQGGYDEAKRRGLIARAIEILHCSASQLDKLKETAGQKQKCEELAFKVRRVQEKFTALQEQPLVEVEAILANKPLVLVNNYKSKSATDSPMIRALPEWMCEILVEDHGEALLHSLSVSCSGYVDETSFYFESNEKIKAVLQKLTRRLSGENGALALEVKKILTDILILTCMHPVLDHHQLVVLSPQRFLALLEMIVRDFYSIPAFLAPLGKPLSPTHTVYQKLLLISRLNFQHDQLQRLGTNPLCDRILNCRPLRNFMFHSLHVNQLARQSCVGASHNHLIQSRCGTIAELLYVADAAVAMAKANLEACPPAILQRPAYDVNTGTAPSVQDYVVRNIAEVSGNLELLRQGALNLCAKPNVNLDAVRRLTTAWNYALQQLEAILNPERLVILSQQLFPNYYKTSAVLSALATSTTAWMPGQPTLAARFEHDIDHRPLKTLHGNLFGYLRMERLGDQESQVDLGSALQRNLITIQEIWKQLYFWGGGIIIQSAHALAVFAVRVEGKCCFVFRDSVEGEKRYSFDECENYLKSHPYIFMLAQPYP